VPGTPVLSRKACVEYGCSAPFLSETL